jgi:hypothetical protein
MSVDEKWLQVRALRSAECKSRMGGGGLEKRERENLKISALEDKLIGSRRRLYGHVLRTNEKRIITKDVF